MYRTAAILVSIACFTASALLTVFEYHEEEKVKYQLSQIDPVQKRCLALNVYHEARGEPLQGQIAVAAVTVNRTQSKYWPSTICEVVYQGSNRKTGCQFSWTCDRRTRPVKDQEAYTLAETIAEGIMLGELEDPTGGSKFYHRFSVRPYWAEKMEKVKTIGRHVFYDHKLKDENGK